MEALKVIYIHLSPNNLPFSNEFENLNYTYNSVPEYTQISIDQTKKYIDTEPIIITNNDLSYFKNEILNFFNLCKVNFPSFYKDSFWMLTFLRLYILFLYVKTNNINKFIHLENDNLIYLSSDVFKDLPNGCYFSQVGPTIGSSGIMFCNDTDKLQNVIDSMLHLIKRGEKIIRRYTNYDFLSEMILIDILVRGKIAEYLPLLPTDNFFNLTNCVFDGASYGQYIGGTNNGNAAGWYGLHHYVGQKIHTKELSIDFNSKKPYILYNGIKANIFNLHIHSKKLSLYV